MAAPCFLMAPWAGRIGGATLDCHGHNLQLPADADGNAKHGLVRGLSWNIDGHSTQTHVRLHCDVEEIWPGRAFLDVAVSPEELSMTIGWDSSTDVPCILGFHPWFAKTVGNGIPLTLDVDLTHMVERRGRLPTGRLTAVSEPPWDDCFLAASNPVLRWGDQVAIELSASTSWWVIYTEPDNATCVEPQTAPPDAFAHPRLQPASARWPTSLTLQMTRK